MNPLQRHIQRRRDVAPTPAREVREGLFEAEAEAEADRRAQTRSLPAGSRTAGKWGAAR